MDPTVTTDPEPSLIIRLEEGVAQEVAPYKYSTKTHIKITIQSKLTLANQVQATQPTFTLHTLVDKDQSEFNNSKHQSTTYYNYSYS